MRSGERAWRISSCAAWAVSDVFRLMRAELYRLRHDRSFWVMLAVVVAANAVVLSGGRQLEEPGRFVLGTIMLKSIVTMMIAGVYGGLFFGRDFEERTFGHPVESGASRGSVLAAKAVVFVAATDVLVLVIPVLAVAACTMANGWGAPFDAGEGLALLGRLGALALLAAAIAMVSILAAVLSRSAGPTIGIAVGLAIAQIPLLNGPTSTQLSNVLPIGAMCHVADGSMLAVHGAGLGILWCAALMGLSLLVVRRVELR